MKSPSQILLLSGGLDSAVNLAMALEKGEVLMGLTLDYGQHAAGKEIEAAGRICTHYSIPHRVIRLPWMEEVPDVSLIQDPEAVPLLNEEDLKNKAAARGSARAVWVPNRNGLFIHIAAVLAESMGAEWIIAGFNKEEGETFPDNTRAFLDAVNASLEYSTLSGVKATSYTIEMMKKEIVETGIRHHVPFEHLWSCYSGKAKMCGRCESCLRLKRAIGGTEAQDRLDRHFFE